MGIMHSSQLPVAASAPNSFSRRLVQCLFAAFAAIAAVSPAFAQSPSLSLTRSDLAAFADSFFARYLNEYPDPSLALVVMERDSILFMKGYGTEDGQLSVDPSSTVFNVASLSKLVVAMAAMQLVEQGAIGLDTDIEPFLGGVRISGTGPPVTLRHLLTHTSGLEGPFLREVVPDAAQMVTLREYFTAHPPRRGRLPGTEIRYSNYAMALAGYLIEQVSGEPFHDYVDRHVFAPLGMTSSSFRQPPPPALAARVATEGAGPVPDALLTYPSGAMVSSPADMALFMAAHLNGGRAGSARVLSEAGIRAMHARQWGADPRAPGVALGFFESTLGGQPGLFHTGARTHFSLLYVFPQRRVGIFIVHAMRQGGEFQALRTGFVRAFAAQFFPQTPPPPVLDDDGAATRAGQFAGVYRPHLLPTTTIERAAGLFSDTRVRVGDAGVLELLIPAGPALTLVEVGEGLYRATGGPDDGLVVAFRRDERGRVGRMSLSGSTQDPISFERLAWYQRGTFHAGLLAVCFVLFVGLAVATATGGAIRVFRRHARPAGPPGAARTWAAATTAALLITASPVSIAVLILMHRGDDAAADGLRLALTVGCTFLIAGTAVGLSLVPLSIRVWQRRYWSPPRRTFFYALAGSAVLAVPLLLHYHLLGYWF
ncbi:MAG: beta-lactamase family protein [Betaproteobacteria bacterium]|nr:beta-lactamase family protein [Betaproteobacteria bacterium]